MPIHIIACVTVHDNKLAIGRENGLLVRISKDLCRFKTLTTNVPSTIVVMGRKTWESLPVRPLPGRVNIVLTRNASLWTPLPTPTQTNLSTTYFTAFDRFKRFYATFPARDTPTVFVIGGAEIYRLGMSLTPKFLFFTEIYGYKGPAPSVYMDKPPASYRLTTVTPKQVDPDTGLGFRFLNYQFDPDAQSQEYKYLRLCRHVLDMGNHRPDRTGVGTIGIFGAQLHFDISQEIPLLTTKRVAWKHCIEELLWFLRGDTDTKILEQRGVKIWKGNTSREFLDAQGLAHYNEGILGPGYGWNWRFFGASYDTKFADTTIGTPNGGFDQIEYVLRELQTNPFSRRIVVSAWNPTQMDQVALVPCHYTFQFYVEEDSLGQRHLSCHFVMRSNDLGCGLSFNLLSYTALTYILAMKCGMKPKRLVYSCSDAHIYTSHVAAIEHQLTRTPTVAPKLWLNPQVKDKSFSELVLDDFEVVGYYPDAPIRMEMAV